jgi:hypothetical protein
MKEGRKPNEGGRIEKATVLETRKLTGSPESRVLLI